MTRLEFLLAVVLALPGLLLGAANSVAIKQANVAGTAWTETIFTPANNTLMGFNSSARAANVTLDAAFSLSSNTLSPVFGTGSNTFAEGNDSRISGAAQKASNLSDLLSASSARSNLGLGTMATQEASAVAITGGTITGLPSPSGASDAATKGYVDGISAGIVLRPQVAVATTANITLSGEQTIDGVLTASSRVLVMDQSLPENNGVYDSAAGAWSRAADSNTAGELATGYTYFVVGGTTQSGSSWTITTAPVSLGTDPVVFSQFSASQSYTAGTGLTLGGNQFSLNSSLSGLTISGSSFAGVFNGTVGATTPSTVSATTIAASSTISAGSTISARGAVGVNHGFKAVNSAVAPQFFAYDGTINQDYGGGLRGYSVALAGGYVAIGTVQNNIWVPSISADFANDISFYGPLSFTTLANLRTTKTNLNIVLNVKDYGAVGDGSTNDTTAISDAFASATSNSVVFFPPGQYNVTGNFGASGLTNVLIIGYGATLYQTNAANQLLTIDRTCSKVTIQGLKFGGAAGARANGCHLRFDATTGWLVDVEAYGASDFGIFIGQHGNATPTKDVFVVNCYSHDNQGDSYHADNVDGLMFIGCKARNSGDDSFGIIGYESANTTAKNVSIYHCEIVNAGFRGVAAIYVDGLTIDGLKVDGAVGSGIEISADNNHTGVFNDNVVIRNVALNDCVSSIGPYGAMNIYFVDSVTLQNVAITNPVAASGFAFYDFSSLQMDDCSVVPARSGFCRGILSPDVATMNSRAGRSAWGLLSIQDFKFNFAASDNNEAMYIAPNSAYTIDTLLLTGAQGSQVPTGNYIYYNRIATVAKIGNNTCAQSGRTVGTGGSGVTATTFNNN